MSHRHCKIDTLRNRTLRSLPSGRRSSPTAPRPARIRIQVMGHKIEADKEKTTGDTQKKAHDEFQRRYEVLWARVQQRQLARAIEAGFSSVREHEEAVIKEEQEREAEWRKRIEAETGKTWEEYWATHPQREKTPTSPVPQCDCEEHPIPMFCAKSLVDYRTQDAPDLVGFLHAKGDQDLANLEIDPNTKSKRLSPEILEQYWQRDTQDGLSQWPPWLKQDSVFLRIKQQDARDSSQERLEAVKRWWQGTVSPSPSRSMPIEERGDIEMADAARLPTPTSCPSICANPSIMTGNEAEVKQQEADTFPTPINESDDTRAGSQSRISKRKTTIKQRTRLTRPSKVSKNAGVAKRHRGKEIRENTRQTRSQNMTKFYELDPHSNARTYRKYG